MKKILIILPVSLVVLVYWSCKKNESFNNNSNYQDPFVSNAIKYLQTQISSAELESLSIAGVRILGSGGLEEAIIIPPKKESGYSIILQKDKGNYIGNWLRFSLKDGPDNGIISTNSFDGNLNNEVTFVNNRAVKLIKTIKGKSKTIYIKYPDDNTLKGVEKNVISEAVQGVQNTETSSPMYTEMPNISVAIALNNNNSATFYSVFWITNQNPSNFYNYTRTLPTWNSGGGSTGNSGYVSAPTFTSPDHPISVADEMKCFTNISGSRYSITVYVNQPRPGSRDLVNIASPDPVGHTFLTFEQDNINGDKIIRSVGFYPVDFAKPGFAQDASIFGDDSNTSASVSLKITVSQSDFNKVVQKIIAQTSKHYHVDTYNCSTSAIDALSTINIYLPATVRNDNVVAPFTGNDPGDLGEDIRGLNLTTFGQQNGNRPMVRSSSLANSIKPAPRTGTCR